MIKRTSFLLLFLFSLTLASSPNAGMKRMATRRVPVLAKCTVDEPFVLPAGCTLPFKGRTGLDVDSHCPVQGCNKDKADQAQNRMKNNLCAASSPVEVGFATFDRLQGDVDQSKTFKYRGNGGNLSRDRKPLSEPLPTVDANGNKITLSEGRLVTLTAIVQEAKHDDVPLLNPKFHGEGVNCNNDDVEWNDIHIVLGEAAGSPECSSVTAEIIPHFRPALWDRFDSNLLTAPHLPEPALPVQGLKVRITGQLFFDGSHAACGNPNKSSSDPERRSVWEIHPVYRIEVFDGGKFISLEEWATKH